MLSGSKHRAPWYYDGGRDIDALALPVRGLPVSAEGSSAGPIGLVDG